MTERRIVILSDLHCGHLVGLTPPSRRTNCNRAAHPKRKSLARVQGALWGFYAQQIDALKPIDSVIVNGDMIDGKGAYSGGTEQTTTDRDEQADMAIECIRYTGAKKYYCIYGTDTHTGKDEDWENIVAKELGAKIGGHEWIGVNGVVFDCKHHIGSSSVPHGRHTAVARDRLWNILWSERQLAPRGDVIIRSHVHYHSYCGGPGWLAITTPALQGMGSKYGSRRCSGIVDFGFTVFDVSNKGAYAWRTILASPEVQRAKLTVAW